MIEDRRNANWFSQFNYNTTELQPTEISCDCDASLHSGLSLALINDPFAVLVEL